MTNQVSHNKKTVMSRWTWYNKLYACEEDSKYMFQTKLHDLVFPSLFMIVMQVCRDASAFQPFLTQHVSYFLPACSCLCCSCTPSTAWWKSNTAEEGEREHTHSHTSEKAGLTHPRTHAFLQAFTQIETEYRPERTYLYVLCLRWSAFSPSLLSLNTQRYALRIFTV